VYSVDIDVGGTLTDGIFSDGTKLVCAKVDTTPHDLTVCLFDCLENGGRQLGFSDLPTLLERVELIRWSTTITSNVLAELRGPKIGLIVSKGHERDLYGERGDSPILGKVIADNNIIGITNSNGPEILAAVRSLLEGGVRRICISLKGGLQNPESERQIKHVLEEQYPDHFLGSVPVLTGSDICQNGDDMTRTYYAVINAYTHSALAATLFKAEDELRYRLGYRGAFLISHINGGVAGISKTRAIDTMESGPVLGIHGSCHLAKTYGLKRVIALDVGGTTTKIGIIHDGEPVHSQASDLFGIPVRVRLPYLRSIALGGGSIVSVQGKSVRLGPESTGSFPGPACYALGGERATLTDAFVTAGLIDPEYFLGGTKTLDPAAAREAIAREVAAPCGTTVEEACNAIIDRAYGMVSNMIETATRELKQDLSDHVLFAYGGNGGLFACGVAERSGLNEVYLFQLGPVFSAFGSSVSDIRHVYERSLRLPLWDAADVAPLNNLIDDMHKAGVRDLKGEGVQPEGVEYSLEFEVAAGGPAPVQIKCAELRFADAKDLRRKLGDSLPAGDIGVEVVRLQVTKPIAKATDESLKAAFNSSSGVSGMRKVSYGRSTGEVALHSWDTLRADSIVPGCALLESASSTYFVPDGWSLQIDQFGNAHVTRNLGRWKS